MLQKCKLSKGLEKQLWQLISIQIKLWYGTKLEVNYKIMNVPSH